MFFLISSVSIRFMVFGIITWVFQIISALSPIMCIILALLWMPVVTALPGDGSFPDITFKVFSDFIQNHFSSKITLTQVLLVLFTVTDNTDLLSLHARQQHGTYDGEGNVTSTGWIRSLARALQEKMGTDEKMLFETNDMPSDMKDKITDVGSKLDGLAKILKLDPYDKNGVFQGKLAAVSYESFHAAQVICPTAVVCETLNCLPCSLCQKSKSRDIPRVTLIKGSTIHENIQLLSGYCPCCKAVYVAD